ncbi:MAG: M12 family metallo-peptidase [Candidatus Methanomethylicaceae archaeon]
MTRLIYALLCVLLLTSFAESGVIVKSKSVLSGSGDGVLRGRVELDRAGIADLRRGDMVVWEVDGRSIALLTQDVEVTPDGRGFVWTGKSISDGLPFILSAYDGYVSGSAFWDGVEARIVFPSGGGEGVVEKMIGVVFPSNEGDAVIPPDVADVMRAGDLAVRASGSISSDGYIDILALYSRELRDYLGGESGVKAEINKVVAYVNEAFANSGVNFRARVVDFKEVDFDVSDINAVLESMYHGSGVFSFLPSLMDQLGADQATAFFRFRMDKTYYCGIAYMPNRVEYWTDSSYESFRKSIFRALVGIGSDGIFSYPVSTFAHELGHNLGCHHDVKNVSPSGEEPLFPYAHGYCGDSYGTVMSYCYPRIPYYSENRVVEGKVIGDLESENAKVIRWTAPYLSAVRERVNVDQFFTAKGKVAYQNGRGVAGVEVRIYNGNELFKKTVTDASGAWSVSGLTTGTSYKVLPVLSKNLVRKFNVVPQYVLIDGVSSSTADFTLVRVKAKGASMVVSAGEEQISFDFMKGNK